MALAELEKAFKKARKAWRADKEDKKLKKAWKKAKAAFEAAKAESAAADSTETPKTEETKANGDADLNALKKKFKAARKAWRADKTDKKLKKAFKAAKAAYEEAQKSSGAEEEKEETATTAGVKRGREEEEEKKEEGGDATAADSSWEVLSAKKKQKTSNDLENLEANPKCFLGNLSWDIDDDKTREFFKDCGQLTDIYWLTNKEDGRFKGCGFVTFESTEAAQKAVQKNGLELMGRPLKINFAKPRPGGDRQRGGGKGGSKGSKREPSERPEGGTSTVFVGNLSFDIDDDKMRDFAKDCGEIYKIRWLTDRESGDFKGCGFIDFDCAESVDNFIKKNGEDLMGRIIRIDYATPRN